jgi:hypothetical protein
MTALKVALEGGLAVDHYAGTYVSWHTLPPAAIPAATEGEASIENSIEPAPAWIEAPTPHKQETAAVHFDVRVHDADVVLRKKRVLRLYVAAHRADPAALSVRDFATIIVAEDDALR